MDDRHFATAGSTIIADTTLTTGRWYAIVVINDAVLNTSTTVCANMANLAGLNGKTLAAGRVIFGNFTTIQLVSGVVQATLMAPA